MKTIKVSLIVVGVSFLHILSASAMNSGPTSNLESEKTSSLSAAVMVSSPPAEPTVPVTMAEVTLTVVNQQIAASKLWPDPQEAAELRARAAEARAIAAETELEATRQCLERHKADLERLRGLAKELTDIQEPLRAPIQWVPVPSGRFELPPLPFKALP